MAGTVGIALVDDDAFLRGTFSHWIAGHEWVSLLGSHASVSEYLDAAPGAQVVLLDLDLGDGTTVTDNVAMLVRSGARVLVISTHSHAEHVFAAINAGASGYVTKDNDLATLGLAIRRIAEKGTFVSQELAFAMSADHRANRPRLTRQEAEVVSLYGSGMAMKSVARRMGIAESTANAYLKRAKRRYAEQGRPTYTKLDVADRVREDRLASDEPLGRGGPHL